MIFCEFRPVSSSIRKKICAYSFVIAVGVKKIMPCENNLKLREAADQLVKAALEDATITKPLTSFKESVEAKFDAHGREIDFVKEELKKMNAELIQQSQDRRLEWAISNCAINSFKFYTSVNQVNPIDSTDLARQALFAFRTGKGQYITDGSMIKRSYNQVENENGEKLFRDNMVKQIHQLMGRPPRLAKAEQGYAIYYS